MTAPAGDLCKRLYNLQSLVAASATFRTSVGAADVAAARDRIYWPTHTFPTVEADIERPYAWIQFQKAHTLTCEHSGGGPSQRETPLRVMFEAAYDPEDTEQEQEIKFWNWMGQVLEEMAAVANTEGYLIVNRFVVSEISRSDPKEAGQYFQVFVDIEAGG